VTVDGRHMNGAFLNGAFLHMETRFHHANDTSHTAFGTRRFSEFGDDKRKNQGIHKKGASNTALTGTPGGNYEFYDLYGGSVIPNLFPKKREAMQCLATLVQVISYSSLAQLLTVTSHA